MEFNDLAPFIGGDTYTSMFSDLGFGGGGYNDPNLDWAGLVGTNEAGNFFRANDSVSDEAKSFINDKNLNFNWEQTGPGFTGTLSAYNPNRTLAGMWKQKDDVGDPLASLALGLTLGPLAGGLAGAFGGGLTGKIAAGALTGGLGSVVQGGKFGEGLLSGAIGGAVSGFNPASKLGITNSLVQRGVNSAISGTLSGMARGADFKDALKGAATGAAFNTAGAAMNDFFGNLWKNVSSGGDDGFGDLMGSGGDMSGQTDVSPNTYEEMRPGPDGNMQFSPDFRFNDPSASYLFRGGDYGSLGQTSAQPDARPQSFSFPSLNQLGSFAANNAGTLAQMLYGMYNNRRQQRLIGDQIAGLRGLYGQNSPYAQQLRARLNAQAAAGGRRSNTGARETQLQAMLADRAASLAPSLAQMQLSQNALRNNNLGIVMGGVRNLKGLGDLFGLGG